MEANNFKICELSYLFVITKTENIVLSIYYLLQSKFEDVNYFVALFLYRTKINTQA